MNPCEIVSKIIKPGDVISLDESSTMRSPFKFIGLRSIRTYQKELFGEEADYRPTHTVFYFSDDKVFSMTYPVARWETLEYQTKQKFKVMRFTKQRYTDRHLQMMFETASHFIGSKYDIGDLLDIMINKILGYPHEKKISVFEFSKNFKVCSTAVRTIQEKLRKDLEKEGYYGFNRLFDKLNPEKWSPDEIEKFKRTDVEMTTPAHYTNSEWFDFEFITVCSWKDFK